MRTKKGDEQSKEESLMRMLRWPFGVAATVVFLISSLCAQSRRPDSSVLPPRILTTPNIELLDANDGPLIKMERRAQVQIERDRERALKQETDQLLAMAKDLKQNVDNSSPSILSLDLIKKTEKIEKLAKSIREKMKGN